MFDSQQQSLLYGTRPHHAMDRFPERHVPYFFFFFFFLVMGSFLVKLYGFVLDRWRHTDHSKSVRKMSSQSAGKEISYIDSQQPNTSSYTKATKKKNLLIRIQAQIVQINS